MNAQHIQQRLQQLSLELGTLTANYEFEKAKRLGHMKELGVQLERQQALAASITPESLDAKAKLDLERFDRIEEALRALKESNS